MRDIRMAASSAANTAPMPTDMAARFKVSGTPSSRVKKVCHRKTSG
jgi:hypothetical protein